MKVLECLKKIGCSRVLKVISICILKALWNNMISPFISLPKSGERTCKSTMFMSIYYQVW